MQWTVAIPVDFSDLSKFPLNIFAGVPILPLNIPIIYVYYIYIYLFIYYVETELGTCGSPQES